MTCLLKRGAAYFQGWVYYHEIMVIIIPVRNHAEDMVAMSPLTANVCISHHETFRFKCKSIYVSTICQVTFSHVLGSLVLCE